MKDKEICEGITTIDLCNDSADPQNPVVDLFKIKNGKRTNIWAGALRLVDFKIIDHENFAAYLQAGLKMSLSMAIDFSCSNGQVWDSAIGMWKFKKLKKKDFNIKKVPWIDRAESGFDQDMGMITNWKFDKTFGASAHTTEQHELIDLGRTGNKMLMVDGEKKRDPKAKRVNDYQFAIREVGAILEQYDATKEFLTFGFGAIPEYMGKECMDKGLKYQEVLHAFPLNGDFDSPAISGIDGVLKCYEENILRMRLAGPTLFAEFLEEYIDMVEAVRDAQDLRDKNEIPEYFVLMIITDGQIHDLKQTTRLVVRASELPISIVIVGVGEGPFQDMDFLDADEKLLKDDKKNRAKRDIVQFVQLSKAKVLGNLQEEVMREIPEQVCGFMEQHDYKID